MGSGSVRHLLKSLCNNTQWKYAVFWKFRHHSRMCLSWEDGYYDYRKERDPLQQLSENLCFSKTSGTAFSGYDFDADSEITLPHKIGLAVADMSYLSYSFDQGFVGKVASSGRHLWVLASELNSRSSFDFPAQWQSQFAAGIKTILLVPVAPLGVVQLGSLETVVEDLALVAHIKDLFNTFPSVCLDFPFSSIGDPFDPQLPFPSPVFEDLSSSPSIPLNMAHPKLLKNNPSILDMDKIMSSGCSTVRTDMPSVIMDENSHHLLQDQQMPANLCNMAKGNLPSFVCPLVGSYISQHNTMNQLMQESSPVSHSWEKGMEQGHHDVMVEAIEGKSGNNIRSFPFDSELHKALEPAFHSVYDTYPLNATFPEEDRSGNMNVVSQMGSTVGVHKASNDYLLDAVIAKIYRQSGENACDEFDAVISSNCSSDQLGGEVLPCSPSGSSSRVVSTLTNVNVQSGGQGNAHEQSKLGRRKGRTADVCRPRPRDRQMIQDRVKELREIVPNGGKCSIDALLERTIKHMVFLRNITNRAEKLRKCSQSKVRGNENWGGLKSTRNTSWAKEFGCQPGICPIIVENLEQHGQMLVEILCEDRDLFLEVADVMRRLNLNILKGIMEKRTKKTWAHFIVEVSKGFQRMDILLPLMQLLQRHQSL
ncbi:transcription factor EMB1444-like [Aristolochia californica]|uniref:transcription factor EMB1444-like n=1 Tax=Aristolochia californica TaxID=171875 RepID=UPI0035E32B22